MNLQWIAIILGILFTAGGLIGLFRPDLVKRVVSWFPRSIAPSWILTILCCWLGAKEAYAMKMGVVSLIKPYIPLIAVGVFAASVVYMKELLAPRALGGFLLLIAVPIVRTAALSSAPMFQILVAVVYLWIICGIILLMSPWYFRKFYEFLLGNEILSRLAAFGKTVLGIVLLMLGIFAY